MSAEAIIRARLRAHRNITAGRVWLLMAGVAFAAAAAWGAVWAFDGPRHGGLRDAPTIQLGDLYLLLPLHKSSTLYA